MQAAPVWSDTVSGTPALHAGCVHSLASSAGTSPLSAALVTSPLPSHCSCWQSPCIWSSLGSGLPGGSGVTTQLPVMHAMGAQKVPPVQSLSMKQLWQLPLSSHICEPAGPHVPPTFTGGLLGTPAVHTSAVQSLSSDGRSVLSAVDWVPPELPHVSTWQSPATWLPEGMLSAGGLIRQEDLLQVAAERLLAEAEDASAQRMVLRRASSTRASSRSDRSAASTIQRS